MKRGGAWLVLTAVVGGLLGLSGQAQDAADLVTRAADALGGRDRLLAIRTVTIDNVQYRKLQVERDLPVHGRILPLSEVQQNIARQIANARQLCDSVETAGLSMRGCPVKETVHR